MMMALGSAVAGPAFITMPPAITPVARSDPSTRAGESSGRYESGGDEPNYYSAQSAPVSTQCGGGTKRRSASHLCASDNLR